MERITKKIGSSVVFPSELVGVVMAPHDQTMYKILTKLARYEDTGMEPEEVKALIDASMGKAIAEITEFEGVSIQWLKELAEAWTSGNIMVLSRAHWTYWYGWRGNHDRRIDDAICSRCGFRHPTIWPTEDDPYTPHQLLNYCPNCLAMMVEDNVERR